MLNNEKDFHHGEINNSPEVLPPKLILIEVNVYLVIEVRVPNTVDSDIIFVL